MQLPVAVCSERNLSDGYGPGPGCRPAAVAFFRTGAAQSGPWIVRGGVSADRQAGMRAVCPGNEAEASRAEQSQPGCERPGIPDVSRSARFESRVPSPDVVIS